MQTHSAVLTTATACHGGFGVILPRDKVLLQESSLQLHEVGKENGPSLSLTNWVSEAWGGLPSRFVGR